MIRLIPISLLFLSTSVFSCEEIKSAHNKLLSSNFKLNKHFILKLDDEKKLEETETISYQDRKVSRTETEIQFIAEDYKVDTSKSNDEIFMKSDFTCDDVLINDNQVQIEFQKDDVKFITEFSYEPTKKVLKPLKTTMSGEVGFLFVSWTINAVTSFNNFTRL